MSSPALFQNIHQCHSEQIFMSTSWEIAFKCQLSPHNPEHLGSTLGRLQYSVTFKDLGKYPPHQTRDIKCRAVYLFESIGSFTCHYNICLQAVMLPDYGDSRLGVVLWWRPPVSWVSGTAGSVKHVDQNSGSEQFNWSNSAVWSEGHRWGKWLRWEAFHTSMPALPLSVTPDSVARGHRRPNSQWREGGDNGDKPAVKSLGLSC